MKTCLRCNRTLEDVAFYRRLNTRCGLSSWCKSCTRQYELARYGAAYRSGQIRTRAAAARERNRLNLWRYLLEHPCVDCGERDPVVLEFDHVEPRQGKCVTSLLSSACSWGGILKKIGTCDVVCSACHTRRTLSRANSWRLHTGDRAVYVNAADLCAGRLPALRENPGRATYQRPGRIG